MTYIKSIPTLLHLHGLIPYLEYTIRHLSGTYLFYSWNIPDIYKIYMDLFQVYYSPIHEIYQMVRAEEVDMAVCAEGVDTTRPWSFIRQNFKLQF